MSTPPHYTPLFTPPSFVIENESPFAFKKKIDERDNNDEEEVDDDDGGDDDDDLEEDGDDEHKDNYYHHENDDGLYVLIYFIPECTKNMICAGQL
ncbi:hypothetical protein DPMN_037028 [Dreissena polymorpha]|uniref:Uncharacterized protein n=1 Tax=Dreissena polymorpha TaxID=45954 RepID=A0A9D4MBV8_DREPO|nr:hypothetical protein DPMN_037028 [Dreissena polymorpha]